MTRTFCDICGEELEHPIRIHNGATHLESNSIVKDRSVNFRILFWIGAADPLHLCRKCVLEAIRYIADNK